jgi:hypothetical protein
MTIMRMRMRIVSWVPKATDTDSEYVTIFAFPLQRRLHESTSMLLYTYIACLVIEFKCKYWYVT